MRVRDRVHTDRLPPSYYAATSVYTGGFPRMEGNVRTQVCVIGGGFTGVACALALAERGVDVALVEQNQIGWGASGRNGGQILGGYGPDVGDYEQYERTFGASNANIMWQVGHEGVDIVRDTVERYNIECDLRWGYLEAARNEREMKELAASQAALKAHGYPHAQRMVSENELSDVIGSNRFIGGLVNEGWGHCHPLNLVRGQAFAAEKLGAKIFEDARVSKIDYETDSIVVDMDWGRVTADQIVVATNAYIGPLVPKLEAIILPVGSYIIATAPLTDEQARDILPGNHAVCDMRWDLDYFRLSADNRLLFGGVAAYSGRHPSNIAKKMRPKMLKVFPQLSNVAIDYEWGGYLGISKNRIPQVGCLEDRTYYAQAYSGHGLAASHVSARMIADAIGGDDGRLKVVQSVKHKPFFGKGFLKGPMVTAGMTMMRLKSLFGA